MTLLTGSATRSLTIADITRDAETAIGGHSRSHVVVPIDAVYMTYYPYHNARPSHRDRQTDGHHGNSR